MVKPYLNKVGGIVEDDVSLFTGGLNTYTNKAFLEADQMPYVMNMTISQPPALRTRDTRTTIAEEMATGQIVWAGDKVVSMWAYNTNLIYFFTIYESTNTYHLNLLKKNNQGKYNQYDILSMPNNVGKPYFTFVKCNDGEFVYFGNEDFKGRAELGVTDASAVELYNDDHYGIPVWHKNRLFLAKPSRGVIEWSNAFFPDDFRIDAGHDSGEVPLTSTRGNITGIATFDDKLMVLCEHSTHAIYGHSGV
jgi:hypothetical protein